MTVYLTELDFAKELSSIEQLVSSLNLATDIVASVDSWWPHYRTFVVDQLQQNLPSTEGEWSETLTQFLFRYFLPAHLSIHLFSVRWVCALPPISNSPSPQQLYVVSRPPLSCSPPSPSPMSSLRCHQTSKPTLRVILGEGGAHTSPEQSEGHYRRLQLLWQCLCSNPSNEIQFRLGGLSFSVSILV